MARNQKRKEKYVRKNWSRPDLSRMKKDSKNSQRTSDFCQKADTIWDGYCRRIEEQIADEARYLERRPVYDRAENYFKRQAYQLLCRYKSDPQDRQFVIRFVQRNAPCSKLPKPGANFFYWGLIAIYTAQEVSGRAEIEKAIRKISKLSWQMRYAEYNKVKAQMLVGFLYQSGCADRLAQVKGNMTADPSLTLSDDFKD